MAQLIVSRNAGKRLKTLVRQYCSDYPATYQLPATSQPKPLKTHETAPAKPSDFLAKTWRNEGPIWKIVSRFLDAYTPAEVLKKAKD